MNIKEYQNYCGEKLNHLFSDVVVEWNPYKGCNVNNIQYCPRLDIAIGPFAINNRLGVNYDKLQTKSVTKNFINLLIDSNNQNILSMGLNNLTKPSDFSSFNYNSRCFICIEIENRVSRKHIVGGLVNASALGRIAVLVAWTPDKLKAFIKLKEYLKELSELEKNSFKTNNVLILDKDQFKDAIDSL